MAAARSTPTTTPPSYTLGRRGAVSVTDTLIKILWKQNAAGREWPLLSIGKLRESASQMLRYAVPSSTIRSTLYTNADLFKRRRLDSGNVAYELTEKAKKGIGRRDQA